MRSDRSFDHKVACQYDMNSRARLVKISAPEWMHVQLTRGSYEDVAMERFFQDADSDHGRSARKRAIVDNTIRSLLFNGGARRPPLITSSHRPTE